MHARTQPQARPLRLGSAEVYTGTCSWTRGFEQWYPPHLRTTSAGRLAYYASHFPAVEVDSTYYALPRPGQTDLLARRTPQGFLFGVKAFGPLTGHPTDPARLPEPARLALPPELRSAERLWPRDLPRETLEACQDGKRAQPGSTRAVGSDRDPENQLSVRSPGSLGKAPAFPPRLEAHQPELLQDPQVCLHALEIPPQHPGKLVHRLRSGSADGPQQLHASRREDPAGAV
jgi:hypothetical protein